MAQNNQKIRLKRQSQTGSAAVGKRPTPAMLEDGELAINTVDGKLFLKKTPVTGSPTVIEVGANPYPTGSGADSKKPVDTGIVNKGKFLTTDGTYVSWATPNTVSAAAIDIEQTAHGFTPGTILYHTGTTYARAKADSVLTADVIGIVGQVTTNGFTLITNGFVDFEGILTNGPWVAGTTYYLSATSAGVLTDTEPTAAGQISKPLLIAITSKRGFFYNWRGISNEIPFNDIDDLLPQQDANTIGKVLTSGADGNAYWSGSAGGGGASSSIPVTQTAHGFTIGTLLRYDGGLQKYVKAQANNGTNADVIGVVSSVTDASNFTITTQGLIQGLSGLTAGASYFLSDTTAGAFTINEPTGIGTISKPVLLAVSSTAAVFSNWRGISVSVLAAAPEVAAQTGNNGKFLTTNGSATSWAMPVTSFNTRTGAITLSSTDVTTALGYTPYNASTNPNNFVTTSTAVTSFNNRQGVVSLTLGDITNAGGAPIASPAFTGTPTAPTQNSSSNNTSLATTAFVQTVSSSVVSNALVPYALKASPAFTGTPTAPTPVSSDNSTKLATTAFVQSIAKADQQSLGTSGFVVLPGGLMMQWGVVSIPGMSGGATFTFPTAFPSVCVNVQATRVGSLLDSETVTVTSVSTTAVSLDNYPGTSTTNVYVFAIGY